MEFSDPHYERYPYPSAYLKRKLSAPQLLPIEHATKKSMKQKAAMLPDWTKQAIQGAESLVPEWQMPKAQKQEIGQIEFAKPSTAFLLETLRDQLGSNLDSVLILHQLRRGGAELEALYHIEAIRKVKPNAKIAVLLTFFSDPDWSEHLPKDVVIIEYGKLLSRYIDHLNDTDILYQVLALLRPKMIHVKASDLGWNLFTRFGARLRQFSKLYCSLYCIDYTRDNKPISFAYSHLPWTYNYLTKIFSDNQALKDHLHQTYGYQKIEVLRFPSRVKAITPKVSFKKGGKLKILWASRISRQKNVPWLYAIAKSMPRDEFHVYGEYSERIPLVKELFELKNVIYHGGFDGLDSVPTENYDLFLYTSSWDGFPNVLLEAGLKGIPIISTKVGGITELLNDSNSYLADSCEEMRTQIERLRNEPIKAQEKASRLQNDVRRVHTESKFYETLEREFEAVFSERQR
jgi:glycosyltransferase involved in cell wall biosynthesis